MKNPSFLPLSPRTHPVTAPCTSGGAFHIDQMQDYNHYTDAASTLSSTESELLSLQRAIERRLPRVKVTIDLDREATVDADFFRAATAPRCRARVAGSN